MNLKEILSKYIIGAILIFALAFLFKEEIKAFLNRANQLEVSVFGNTIKVSQEEYDQLLAAQEQFDEDISEFTRRVQSQDTTISSLNMLIADLREEVDQCGEAQQTTHSIDSTLQYLNLNRNQINREALINRDFKIIERVQR